MENGDDVERRTIEVAEAVRNSVKIPVAIKLSPFYSAFANLARSLDEAGVDGIVLFNRFYQPDIDIENLEIRPSLHLSDSSELLLRLRWLAILAGRVNASLITSGGVHTATDAIKAVMAGADAVQMVSAILRHGPEHIAVVRDGMKRWLEAHEYESLAEARGSMSHKHCPDPAALERANYMRILQSWRRNGEW
jgi:dihydroorotate dehydrogenase (fumarate)